MKLFQIASITLATAKNLERASQLANLPVMDPEDASYTMKTKALLSMIGIDIETDAYFDDDGPVSYQIILKKLTEKTNSGPTRDIALRKW